MKALGYTDAVSAELVDGFLAPVYSKEHNTIILAQDNKNLCYDRKHPNGHFNLQQRVLENLPSKPKVYIVNLFEMQN